MAPLSKQPVKYVPRRCVVETTLACNLRCRHCGSRAGAARSDELSTEEMFDLFRQLKGLGCERVSLSGGEPTMRPDWPDLIEGVRKAGMRVGMFTNAIRFDDDAARLAKAKGLESIAFSVDGLQATHDRVRGRVGHYNRLIRAMTSAKRAGLPFAVVTHVNNLNLSQLDKLHDVIVEQGAHAWQVQLGTDMGNMSDNRELLLNPRSLVSLEQTLVRLKRKKQIRVLASDSIGYFGPGEKILRSGNSTHCFQGCHAGLRNMGIESNGNIKGCLSIMAGYNEKGEDFVEGNIREESLADIWNRKTAFAYNRNWNRENLGGFCKECKHADQCKGGCRAKMEASGGGLENPMCIYRIYVEEDIAKNRRYGQAAAVALASLLGGAANACSDTEENKGDEDASVTTQTDTAVGTNGQVGTDPNQGSDGTGQTGSDTEPDMTTDYSAPSPTEAAYSDPDMSTDYSDPWPTQADYSDPGVATDTEMSTDYSDPMTDQPTEEMSTDYSDVEPSDTSTMDVQTDYSEPPPETDTALPTDTTVDAGPEDAGPYPTDTAVSPTDTAVSTDTAEAQPTDTELYMDYMDPDYMDPHTDTAQATDTQMDYPMYMDPAATDTADAQPTDTLDYADDYMDPEYMDPVPTDTE